MTAGNAPGITDGGGGDGRRVGAGGRAARPRADGPGRGLRAGRGRAASWLFLAPIEGVRALEPKTGIAPDAYDLVEVNEAFAAQTLADGRELGFDWDAVNVNGGAIALGPPDRRQRRPDPRDAAPRAGAAATDATASRRCAWAAAAPWRWRSSGSSSASAASSSGQATRASQPVPTPQPGGTTPRGQLAVAIS